jgi:hypothetical protein
MLVEEIHVATPFIVFLLGPEKVLEDFQQADSTPWAQITVK